MGIFRDITKTLKQAAPVIGGTIGFAMGGPYGAAIGSGIASLASGRSAEQSLMNAALGFGAGTMAKGAGFGKGTGTGMEKLLPSKDGNAAFGFGSPSNIMYTNDPGSAIKKANTGMFDKALNFAKENKALTAAGLGSLALLGAGEEEQSSNQKNGFSDYVGQTRLGVVPYKGTIYDLDNESERAAYFQKRQEEALKTPIYAAGGGEVEGPGTGTSDSVPARLSDGEFVVTADAVRGAGGGDRNVGAARMYDMMSQLERAA